MPVDFGDSEKLKVAATCSTLCVHIFCVRLTLLNTISITSLTSSRDSSGQNGRTPATSLDRMSATLSRTRSHGSHSSPYGVLGKCTTVKLAKFGAQEPLKICTCNQ